MISSLAMPSGSAGTDEASPERVEFDAATLPWLDRVYGEIDAYVDALPAAERPPYDLREALIRWMRFGYMFLPGAIEVELIDAYLADLEEVRQTRDRHRVEVMVEGYGQRPISELPEEAFAVRHLRYIDFHNSSIAAKKILLHRQVAGFLRHVFRAEMVAMQSLTFIHSSEQWTHQDYAYVVSGIPSHLAASWIALEDVHAEAGPLAYYPGSHSLRKFDWGPPGRLLYSSESKFTELDFRDHIERECARVGLAREVVIPKKGDVFFWHAALAHAGSTIIDLSRTRRSLVGHYSTLEAYPVDRRAPDREPTRQLINGGWMYANPRLPDEEDAFRHGAAL
ncbi:MAG TPA: phytanoyl-CoA dioxygenase family protein [Thermoanaerobaculia bacterium]|nr:phytanoyl-CoA dioxygenase family protein [Thermoanaerobaculia bacterium]